MYKIYTGFDEYYMSEQNPSDTHIPNDIYDKVYICDSEGRIINFYIDVDILNQLNREQIDEIGYDINQFLEMAYDYDITKEHDSRFNTPDIVNYKLCLNIINTYRILKFNSNLGIYNE